MSRELPCSWPRCPWCIEARSIFAFLLELPIQGGLFEVLYLLYVVVSSFIEAGDVHRQDKVDVGNRASDFSDFFEDNVVIAHSLEDAGEEDQGSDQDKFLKVCRKGLLGCPLLK
jgi:hypothetical protein